MLDSRPSPIQGLNQIQLSLDCRSRPPAPGSLVVASQSATTGPATPRPARCASPISGSQVFESDPDSVDPLSTSTSTSSLYALSSTTTAVSNSTPQPLALQATPSSSVPPRRASLYVDPGSPKFRSPLRNSVSFTDDAEGNDLYFAPPPSNPQPRFSHRRFRSVDMALTGDKRTRNLRPADPPTPAPGTDSSPLTRWFSRRGSTPAESLTVPSTNTAPHRRQSTPSTQKYGSTTGVSRFGFFTSSKDTSTPTVCVPEDDDLINLDIESALFPGGIPVEGSAFSPAAFKNLQMNAAGLLRKFQIAYQQRTIEQQELKAERDAQDEEKDEVEIRVRHLKMQLEEMARKADEREEVMASLLQELALEKRARAEEQAAARERCLSSFEASTVSEDLCVDEDRQKRNWRKSTATAKSDLSLDTDEDSIDEASIFSRSRSPTSTMSVSEISPISTPTPQQKPVMLELPRPSRSSTPQTSGIQKLLKGYPVETLSYEEPLAGVDGCLNCQGQDVSVAWDTVNLLKDENRGLKTRVQELETAVEGALDAVNGLVL